MKQKTKETAGESLANYMWMKWNEHMRKIAENMTKDAQEEG